MNSNRPLRLLAGILACSLCTTALAQTDALTADAGAPTEVYRMAAFEVNTSQDVGYVAVDSLAGGRVSTPLRLTPSTVSSLTSAFIEDLAINDVRGALQWAPNVVPQDPTAGSGFGGSAFHDWSFNYRSAGAGQQGGPGPTRNYFSFYQNADSYNIERIEFLRGPNSLVFGLGTVGGTLAIYTKRARLDDRVTSITGQVDDNGSARLEIDHNQPVGDTIGLRLNAVADNPKAWRENDWGRFRAATLAVLYQPNVSTSVRFEGEYATRMRTLTGTTLPDETSGWDGATASETWGAEPTGGNDNWQAIQNAGAWGDWLETYPVFIPGQQPAIMPWAGGYASTSSLEDIGTNLNWQPYDGWYPDQVKLPAQTEFQSTANIPVLPSNDWTYGNGRSESEYKDFTLTLEQRLGSNMEGTVAAYYYSDDQIAHTYEPTGGAAIDINRQLPNGQPNPNFGKAFADFFLSRQEQSREVYEARAQLNYHFTADLFGAPMQQLFSFSTAYKKLEISARQYLGQLVDPFTLPDPTTWSQNMVWGRIYLDDPNPDFTIPDAVQYHPSSNYWFDFDDTFELWDVAAFSHTRLFDDALSLLAGVRYDTYEEEILEYRRNQDRSDRITINENEGTTYSLGGIYYFRWLGIFANYSQNIQPPHPGSQPLLGGGRPDPEEGKGFEYGIRISTDDNRYYASLTRYQTESEGHLVENPVDLRGIWTEYFDAQPQLDRDEFLTNLAYSDTTALEVKGWEFELTANPTDRIRIQASYAKPDTEIVDYYPAANAYFAENLPAWNAAVENADTEQHADELRNKIADVQDDLNQTVQGALQPDMIKYTASIFAVYSFIEGDPLAGLSIGAGFSKTGRRYDATYDGVQYWGSDITTTNLVISYQTDIRGLRTRFALNVDNLLDKDDPIITAYHWGYAGPDGTHVPDSYYFQTPRTFRFTTTVTF